jgi:peptidyl-prolyl cis-trans isomerase D
VNKNIKDHKATFKNATSYAILMMALFATAFFGVCTPRGQVGGGHLEGVAGSVDGDDIHYSEFSRAYAGQSERLRSRYGDQFNPQILKVANMVIDQLIETRILYKEAGQLGLTATDTEIVKELSDAKAFRDKDNKFSEEAFRRYLRANLYSESTFQEEMRRSMTIQNLRDLVLSASYVSSVDVEYDYRLKESKRAVEYLKVDPDKIEIAVSQADTDKLLASPEGKEKIKAYYDSHKGDYSSGEKVHAQHVLVAYEGARNAPPTAKRKKDEAKARATELLKKLKDAKADFTAIAKTETDEPAGKKSGGDLGFFARDAMVKEFADAAFAMTPGQVSAVVESPFGFHIIKVIEKKPATEITLDAASPQIAALLVKKEKAPAVAKERAEALQKKLANNENIDELLKADKITWEKTEPFALNAAYIPVLGTSPEIVDAVFKLTKVGQVSAAPVLSQKAYFIFKLASRVDADMSKLTEVKKEEMAQELAYGQGYALYRDFESQAKDKFEKKKAIYKNPLYLALDDKKDNQEDQQ